MSVEVTEGQDGRVLEVKLSGRLQHEDYEQFVPQVEQQIREHGKVRILAQLHDFHGWSVPALWDDIRFDAQHFRDIERLAIVGDAAWEHGMAIFCKPFTSAEIRYFDSSHLAEAREWLTS